MDRQAFFRKDQRDFLHTWRQSLESVAPQPHPEPCPYLHFLHFNNREGTQVKEGQVTDENIIDWVQRHPETNPGAHSRVLLAPARNFTIYQRRGFNKINPISLLPFKPDTVENLAKVLNLHVAGLTMNECAETAKLVSPTGVISIYIENLCHRQCWVRLFVVFDPATCTSTSILHNLLSEERAYIQGRLEDLSLQTFSLHPLFVPTLVLELLVREALELLDDIFISSVRLYVKADLIADDAYKHDDFRKQCQLQVDQQATEAEKSLQYEQRSLVLLEKMETAIKIANTLLSWMPEFKIQVMGSDVQSRFQAAGEILQHRLLHIVDTLDLQMIRLKRTQGHTQLNRLGLQLKSTTLGNRLSTDISQQSRDIARETKRDSSAMKAIAVLTMFFLPATFFAAFFAMPLFDWSSSTPSSTFDVNRKFWVYWAVTIPATFVVLVVWRLWYVFDEWRWSQEKRATVFEDFRAWMRSASGSKNGD